jgi:hypothetical protein
MTEETIDLTEGNEFENEIDHQIGDGCTQPGCDNEAVAEIIVDVEIPAGFVERQHHHACAECKDEVLEAAEEGV